MSGHARLRGVSESAESGIHLHAFNSPLVSSRVTV